MRAFGKDPKTGNWIEATPPNAEKDREVTRGTVINFVSDGEYLAENGTFIDKINNFPFQTGITVVDMRGGERLPGRSDLTMPSRVLLMQPTGELTVRTEIDDLADVQAHHDTFGKKKGAAADGGRAPADFGAERR